MKSLLVSSSSSSSSTVPSSAQPRRSFSSEADSPRRPSLASTTTMVASSIPSSRSSSGHSTRSVSPTPTLVGEPLPSSSSSTDFLKPPPSALKLPTRTNSTSSTPSSSRSTSPSSSSFPTPSSSLAAILPLRTPSSNSQTSHRSLDSVWDLDFETHWERRQRADARRLAELKGSEGIPYLTFGLGDEHYEKAVKPRHSIGVRRRKVQLSGADAGEGQGGGNGASGGKSPSQLEAGQGGDNGDVGGAVGEEEYEDSVWEEEEHKPRNPILQWVGDNRRQVRKIMRMKRLHLIIIGLVAFDLVIVIVELIVALLTAGCMSEEIYDYVLEAVAASEGQFTAASFACAMAPTHGREALESAIFGLNLGLLSIFMLEVLAAIYAFGPITYVTSWVTLLDGFVVVTTLCLDVYFHLSKDPAAKSPIAVVILRLWKIFRAIHAIGHALSLHYNEMMEQAEEGRKKLEMERMTESIRLNYVRNALIRATGRDIDPVLIEDEVQRERAAIAIKTKAEEERVYQELRKGSVFRLRSRHGGVTNLSLSDAMKGKKKHGDEEKDEAGAEKMGGYLGGH
ncbi:hypothetical protein JCM11641_005665 [Rhodosporidiobolus odoratus]